MSSPRATSFKSRGNTRDISPRGGGGGDPRPHPRATDKPAKSPSPGTPKTPTSMSWRRLNGMGSSCVELPSRTSSPSSSPRPSTPHSARVGRPQSPSPAGGAVSLKRKAREKRETGLPLRERLYNCVQSGPLSDRVLKHLTVSVNGLEVLCLMVDRMGEEFKPHITTVLPSVIDRLGDAKDQVREQAQQLLLKLMMPASSPQYVFERMSGAFSHKLWHVREGVLVCLQNTINRYGARSLQLSKTVPAICRLLDDQNGQVREAAVTTLTEIYRHVGDKVRTDLGRKGIAPQKLSQIYARFDDVRASGNMLPTADMGE